MPGVHEQRPDEMRPGEDLAGLGDRLLAAAIDLALLVALMIVLLSLVFMLTYSGSPIGARIYVMLGILASPIGFILYSACLEASPWQGTMGKRAIGIKVIRSDGDRLRFGRSVGRAFVKWVSLLLPFGAATIIVAGLNGNLLYYAMGTSLLLPFFGVATIGLSDRNRAIHDAICGTGVVRDPRRYWFRNWSQGGHMKKETHINISDARGVVVQVADEMKDVKAVNTTVEQRNQRPESTPDVATLLDSLATQIGQVSKAATTSDAKKHVKRMEKELERIRAEIAEEAPDKRWYEVSLSGIKQAAEAIGEIAHPVIATVAQLLPLLTQIR